jgi:hypothetical protein
MIDIVFVANSKNSYLWLMTRNAIRTATQNAGMEIGQVVIVEECLTARAQPGAKMLYYDFEFNYNLCLNLGFSVCRNKYIAFCNNDLSFRKNWAINAVSAGYLSVSPSPKHTFRGVIEGYEIGKQVLGWCIIVDRVVMDRIGGFDTPVRFWYSDNVYAEQLKAAGIKHALVGNSVVRHLESQSLKKVVKGKLRMNMQRGQKVLFDEYKKEKYVNTSSKE